MTRRMLEQSQRGFQYVFENYPLFDLCQAGERAHPLLATHEFLNSGAFLQFGRDVTAPRFNMLNLFRVPQKHNVSYVTPAAVHACYSITGRLRARNH